MHINIAPMRSSEEEVQLNNTNTRDANIQVDAQTFRETTDSIATHKGKYNITDLTYINVQIDGLFRPVKALHDSGAMISVIYPRVLEETSPNISCDGKINLRGLFGEPVNADLVTVFVKSPNCSTEFIPVVMATSFANTDLILTDQVAQALLSSRDNECNNLRAHNDVITNTPHDTDTSEPKDDPSTEHPPSQNKDGTQLKAVTKEQLLQEQKQDATLSGSWGLAEKGKGGYCIQDGLLYHRATVAGQLCEQLCVPLSRRSQVLTLAHEVYGAHLGPRKTRDRILLTFYGPTFTSNCKQHCRSCEQCQKRARTTVRDLVPISPISRADKVFSHWFMDCLEPLFPNQNVRYNYCLVLCDSTSRWPAAYPLHSLSAKSVCDALLTQFSLTGVPDIISSDNATNFKGNLATEFLKRLGCCPRFSTPAHPQACGLVERLVGLIKSAISKVAIDHPKQLTCLAFCGL